MKKIAILSLITLWSSDCLSVGVNLIPSRNNSAPLLGNGSSDSITTQPWHSPREGYGSTMPRGGTAMNDFDDPEAVAGVALNSETQEPIQLIQGSVIGTNITRTPYILSPDELERQNRINREVQIKPFQRVCIPFCIILTVSWIVGATLMGIMYEAKKH